MKPEALPPRAPGAASAPRAGALRPRYAAGVVHYQTYGELEACLSSLKCQTLAPARVIVVDHDPIPAELDTIRERHPEVEIEAHPNRGFSAAANLILAQLRAASEPPAFLLLLTPDVELEPDFAENLLGEMQHWPQAALASGKLLRPERRVIDSAGITLPRHRRPRDRGSEEPDRGQYDRNEFVFGVSGAALMIRSAALPDLEIEGEVFDEAFFTYHEDTDLAWRANLLGWRVLYVPGARAVHARRWQRDRRFQVPPHIRRHSFKNHYLQMIKNERALDFVRNLPAIASWELLRLAYVLLRDRAVLGAYHDAWANAGRAWRKRRVLQRRARELEAGRRARSAAGSVDRGDQQPGQEPY